jgi:putative hemolysin
MDGPGWHTDVVNDLALWAIGVAVVATAGSFFFALAETALFSLSKWQVRRLAEAQGERGRQVAACLDAPDDLLATMVLGNTLANGALLGAGLWMAVTGHWPWGWTVAGVLLVALVLGEVLPKTLAVRRPERWSVRIIRPLTWMHRGLRPLHRLAQRINGTLLRWWLREAPPAVPGLSDEEYRELVELAYRQGTLARGQRDWLLQIISLDRRMAREVMVPRAQMSWIRDDLSVEEMIQEARRRRYRRLPIYDEEADTVVGILNVRAFLLDPYQDLSEVIEFPSFVPETMNLLQLLQSLQRQGRGMAIVLDEFGEVAGLVTLEDILAEVVGGRRRAVLRRMRVERLGPGRWRVDGSVRLEEFRQEYPALGEVPEVETMAGLMLSRLGVVPARGESVVFRGLRMTAEEVDERRVRRILVEQVRR